MKEQRKSQSKTTGTKSMSKPQEQTKAKKPEELSIDELSKVSGGVRMKRRFGRT